MTDTILPEPVNKKRKTIDNQLIGKNQVQGIKKCEYFNTIKNRRCGLQRLKDLKYCLAHVKEMSGVDAPFESEISKTNKNGDVIRRVPCTLDPTHSVWEDKLTSHVKKCNIVKAKAKLQDKIDNCPWFGLDYNIHDIGEMKNLEKSNNGELDNEFWLKFMKELVVKYDTIFKGHEELPLNDIEFKKGLEERFEEVSNQKHIKQQSSLIGQLVENGMIGEEIDSGVIIEFGCGRAEFSRYLNRAVNEMIDKNENKSSTSNYLLIDRDSPRVKFDNKIISDSKSVGIDADVRRLKTDIKDLKLIESLKCIKEKNEEEKELKLGYMGISKHLCGVATDLTLRCLINAVKEDRAEFKFNGFLVAMCCRHCCIYDWLLNDSKMYLRDNFDIDGSNFKYFRKMFAWATNGVKPGCTEDDVGEHFTNLSFREREVVGLKMRRILDESRKYAMTKQGFQAKLVKYVKREVSLENFCMVIKGV